MKNKLKETEVDEEMVYLIVDENDNEVCNLTDDDVVEVAEEPNGYFSALYIEWDESEMTVLFDNTGKRIFDGILEIIQYTPERDEFILTISGIFQKDLEELGEEDYLWCVIDKRGKYVVYPQMDSIKYDEEEGKYKSS